MITFDNDNERLARRIVRDIDAEFAKIRRKKGHVVLGLCGGRSVQHIYRLFKEGAVDFTHVHIFMVDERIVPLDAPESNFRLVRDSFANQLLTQGKLLPAQLHPFVYDRGTLAERSTAYTSELKELGGFDVVLLGVGEDGHIGSLHPNHHSIENHENGFITMNDSPKPPKDRMTASRMLLQSAQIGHMFFMGEGKRQALQAFLNPNLSIKECPAKLVMGIEEHHVWTDIAWKV